MTNDQIRNVVTRMVEAGESEQDIAAVIQRLRQPEQTKAPEPSTMDRIGSAFLKWVPNPVGIARGIKQIAQPGNLPTAGALAGGVIGGLVGNVPGAIAGAGIGGGLGKGGEQVARGEDVSLGAMAKRGAGEAALQAAGGAVGKGLQALGKGAYRFALRPTNKTLGKYGDVVSEGLRRGVPVSKGGLRQVEDLKGQALSEKDQALAQAGERISILTKPLVKDTSDALAPKAAEARRAGLGDPSEAWDEQGKRIIANNPPGLAPAELEAIKRTHDNQLGGTFRKLRAREPITPDEQFGVQFTDAARETQEAITPGYLAANRNIMNLSGLEGAIRNRVEGSAGNDALASLGLMFAGPQAIPARIAAMPGVASRGAIAADRAGTVSKYGLPASVRAAMLALMEDDKK